MVHERACPTGNSCRSFLVVLVFNEVDDAFEVDFIGGGDAKGLAFHFEGLVGTVKDNVESLFGDVFQWRVKGVAIFQPDGFQLLEDPTAGFVFACWSQSAFAEAQVGVGNEFFLVDNGDFAQSVALGAGTVRRVEREGVGFGVFVGKSRGGAHQQAAEVA